MPECTVCGETDTTKFYTTRSKKECKSCISKKAKELRNLNKNKQTANIIVTNDMLLNFTEIVDDKINNISEIVNNITKSSSEEFVAKKTYNNHVKKHKEDIDELINEIRTITNDINDINHDIRRLDEKINIIGNFKSNELQLNKLQNDINNLHKNIENLNTSNGTLVDMFINLKKQTR
jgi:chromosome segregation ATPase